MGGAGELHVTDSAQVLDLSAGDFSVRFDKQTGATSSIKSKGVEVVHQGRGPALNLYRSPIDNDRPFRAAWVENRLYRPTVTTESFGFDKQQDGSVLVRISKVLEFRQGHVVHDAAYTVYGNGVIQIANTVTPHGLEGMETLPRVGLKMALDPMFEPVEWHGRGPHENYPDRKSSARLGIYKSSVTDLFTPYLKKREETIVCIDHKMLGLGNASCGPAPLLQHWVDIRPYTFDLTFSFR